MDIMAMQTANKVLRAMNTRYDGAYDVIVATEGQKDFSTTKPHDTTKNTLQVFVNGYHAAIGRDYTHTDNKTFSFTKPLKQGDVVLAMTQVAGVPVFEGVPYDDTNLKALIQELTDKVNAIIDAIDEDGDGEIVDTIGDIKAQWDAADQSLKTLINDKASTASVEAVSQKVDKTAETIATLATAKSVEDLSKEVGRVSAEAQLAKLIDEESGRPYNIKIAGGTLVAKQIGKSSVLSVSDISSYTVGVETELTLTIEAGCDAGQAVDVNFDTTNCTLKVDGVETTTVSKEKLTDGTMTLMVTPVAAGNVIIDVSIERQTNHYKLATVNSTCEAVEHTEG